MADTMEPAPVEPGKLALFIERVKAWWTWTRRAYLYDYLFKIGLALSALGLGSGEKWALWMALVSSLLGVSVASANTKKA